MGFPLGELSSSPEMRCLDLADAVQVNRHEDRRSSFSDNAVERILVRVEGNCTTRLKREWGVLPDHDDNLPWSDGEGPEFPRLVAQDRAVPIGQGQLELHSLSSPNRDTDAPRIPI